MDDDAMTAAAETDGAVSYPHLSAPAQIDSPLSHPPPRFLCPSLATGRRRLLQEFVSIPGPLPVAGGKASGQCA